MRTINIFTVSEAAARFPKLSDFVAAGQDVVIVNRRTEQVFQITVHTDHERSSRKATPKTGLGI